jgi:hypothetical protein
MTRDALDKRQNHEGPNPETGPHRAQEEALRRLLRDLPGPSQVKLLLCRRLGPGRAQSHSQSYQVLLSS